MLFVPKTYTREEADEILRRALQTQTFDGISHDDLVAAAREVGIPSDAIEAAAADLGDHHALNERVLKLRLRKRAAFFRHLVIYLIANAGIFLVDWVVKGEQFFLYPLIIWGVIVALFGVGQLAPDADALLRQAERELEKERRKEARRRRTDGPRKPGGRVTQEFEAAVEEGVSALLGAAAGAIRGLSQRGPRVRVDENERADAGAGPDPEQNRGRRTGRA